MWYAWRPGSLEGQPSPVSNRNHSFPGTIPSRLSITDREQSLPDGVHEARSYLLRTERFKKRRLSRVSRRLGTALPRSSNDLREAKGDTSASISSRPDVSPNFPSPFAPPLTHVYSKPRPIYRAQGRGRGGSLAPREGRLGAAFESPGAPEDEGGHGHRPSRIALSGPLCAGTFLGRLTEVVCGVGVTPRPVVSQVRASEEGLCLETSPIWFRVGG